MSEAAKILWNYLGTSSILFEIFIDDVWIENPIRKQSDYGKKYNLFNNLNFNECLNYLRFLIQEEIRIRRHIKNRGLEKQYVKFFGDEPVTNQLYNGLINSFYAYFYEKLEHNETDRVKFEEQLKILNNAISECRNILK